MGNPSIHLPDWLQHEIDERRGNVSRSQWLQEASQGRLQREDAGEWDVEHTDPDAVDLRHEHAEAVAGGAD